MPLVLLYMYTWFIGEIGRDTGGVTRELWRLLSKDIAAMCDGQPTKCVFRHDSSKVQVDRVQCR